MESRNRDSVKHIDYHMNLNFPLHAPDAAEQGSLEECSPFLEGGSRSFVLPPLPPLLLFASSV